jgi:hypothetical protein
LSNLRTTYLYDMKVFRYIYKKYQSIKFIHYLYRNIILVQISVATILACLTFENITLAVIAAASILVVLRRRSPLILSIYILILFTLQLRLGPKGSLSV